MHTTIIKDDNGSWNPWYYWAFTVFLLFMEDTANRWSDSMKQACISQMRFARLLLGEFLRISGNDERKIIERYSTICSLYWF